MINPELNFDKNVDDKRLGGGSWNSTKTSNRTYVGGFKEGENTSSTLGRFPANLIHDGSEEVEKIFPESKGFSSNNNAVVGSVGKNIPLRRGVGIPRNDSGSASRYFKTIKDKFELLEYLRVLITPKGGNVYGF